MVFWTGEFPVPMVDLAIDVFACRHGTRPSNERDANLRVNGGARPKTSMYRENRDW